MFNLLAVTKCILSELNALGDKFRVVFIEARRFPKEGCKHEGHIEATACMKEVIGNILTDF
jgi:hypothetical protein